jgi:hypothetical protein
VPGVGVEPHIFGLVANVLLGINGCKRCSVNTIGLYTVYWHLPHLPSRPCFHCTNRAIFVHKKSFLKTTGGVCCAARTMMLAEECISTQNLPPITYLVLSHTLTSSYNIRLESNQVGYPAKGPLRPSLTPANGLQLVTPQ